jgi:hypothetical protein
MEEKLRYSNSHLFKRSWLPQWQTDYSGVNSDVYENLIQIYANAERCTRCRVDRFVLYFFLSFFDASLIFTLLIAKRLTILYCAIYLTTLPQSALSWFYISGPIGC